MGRRQGRARLAPRRQHPRPQRRRAPRGRGARGRRDRRPLRGRAAHAHRRRARGSSRAPASGPDGSDAGGERSDGDAASARRGRTRRPAGPRLPPALRRLPRRRAPGSATTCAAELHPLPDDRCRRCGAPLRRAGRPARPLARPASRRHAGLPRVRRPRPRLLRRLGGVLLRRAGARAGHRLQVPRAPLAHRRPGGARGAGVRGRRRPRPAPAPSSPPCRPTATTGSTAASTSPSRSPAGLRATPGSPMLRCSAACVTAPARAGSTGPRARPTSIMRSRCARAAFGVGTRLKRVIIVDDVYTTGETLNQCAEALAHAALDPHVFTFARTVRATPAQASRDHAVPKERCR